ncbi:hypothetical protein HY224_01325 [Candidatus Uhrbacteria bacterium]|nr:hypothetical protein [Candidatus Uhrbacteria bacterium]
MRWLLGILFPIIGFVLVLYTEKIYQEFGSLAFAEKYLGFEGGTRLFYKLLGVLMILIGFGFLTGLHVALFTWIAQNFFGSFMPANSTLN